MPRHDAHYLLGFYQTLRQLLHLWKYSRCRKPQTFHSVAIGSHDNGYT